jgi:glycolate oxidase FAD binding subunit
MVGTHSSSVIGGIEAAAADLRAVMGAEHVRPATPEDVIDGVFPAMIVEPGSSEEVARVLKIAAGAGLRVAPHGGGTKMDWGNPPRGADLILSTRRINRVIEHAWADMTATVEAGCTVERLQQALAEHGQRLALDPLWPEQASIGGILSTNDSGPLRIRFGSLRDLIIGITLALPDGTLAKSGGKVVKNVAGYDLPKLATGALGTLGVITQAIFRLHPIFRETRTMSFSLANTQALNSLLLSIMDSKLVPTGLQVRAGTAEPLQLDIRLEGTSAGCDAQCQQISQMAEGARQLDPGEVWKTTENLWRIGPCIAKFSTLPTQIGAWLEHIKKLAASHALGWSAVAQGVGVGFLRFDTADVETLRELRNFLESSGGSFVLLRCPLELKRQIDVWGAPGDDLPIMKNIKAQFDPTGALNAGRFIGGI